MYANGLPGSDASRLEIQYSEGWIEYRQALELLGQSDWSPALVLLAEAEMAFRTTDDQNGLWRALIGQALLHWREGMAPLAIARAMAALRTAEAADDGFAVGCVAWQIANMTLGQGEYHKAADYLDQAQLALDAVGTAPPGGALAGAAQLCNEIVRWQQMCERQQLSRHEADSVIAALQRELVGRLNHAATGMRCVPVTARAHTGEIVFALTEPAALLALPESIMPRTGMSAWLGRVWRRLISSGDVTAAQALTRLPLITPPGPEPLSEPYTPRIEIIPPAPEPAAEPAPSDSVAPAPAPAPPPAAEPMRVPQPPAAAEAAPAREDRRPGLAIYCFGNFRVFYNDVPIDRWESARGRTIFKYLIARRASSAPKDLLADMFWPDSEPELARRSLHQAIYCLRQTLKRRASDAQIIQFADDRYQISSDIPIWVDSEAFGQAIEQARALYAAGRVDAAMQAYAVAVDLYGAPFLAEDRYEEWTDEPRRSYQAMYLEALHRLARHHTDRGEYPAAIMLCQRALAEESCDEESHQLLMACYLAQGLRHLAVRQYQICANVLKTELGLAPSEEIEAFYRRAVAAG
jgi:DNA-binding SARP family transcriptional activator